MSLNNSTPTLLRMISGQELLQDIKEEETSITNSNELMDNKIILESTVSPVGSLSNSSSIILHDQNDLLVTSSSANFISELKLESESESELVPEPEPDKDDTANKISMIIPLSNSSIGMNKFPSTEELSLLPPLPNEVDLQIESQLETQNLTNPISNSSPNENTLTNNIVPQSFTPVSILDSPLTSTSTPNDEITSLQQQVQLHSKQSDLISLDIIRNTPKNDQSPPNVTSLPGSNTSSTDSNNLIISNEMNTSFDLSKALAMTSSKISDSDNTNNSQHKKMNSNTSNISITHSHKSINLIKRQSDKSSILNEFTTNSNMILNGNEKVGIPNEERIYRISNIERQNSTDINNHFNMNLNIAMDLASVGNIPYISDTISDISLEPTPMTIQSNLHNKFSKIERSISGTTPSGSSTGKKIPFLRRASSTLLRKTSAKYSSRPELIDTTHSAGTTPILNSPSQFDNTILRTRSNSVLPEPLVGRKPTMKRNTSFGSKMRRGLSRIVSNGNNNPDEISSNTYSINTVPSINSYSNDIITPTKPNKASPLYSSTTSQPQSHIQSPLDFIRHTNSSTPLSHINNSELFRPASPTRGTEINLNRKESIKRKGYSEKYIRLNLSVLEDCKTSPVTSITDQISDDPSSLDKIIQQSKLSLLPSSLSFSLSSKGGSFSSQSSFNKNNSNKNENKPDKLSIKEYIQLLISLKSKEIEQHKTIIKALENTGWYSEQEIGNIYHKKDLLNKLWDDRIMFYQNQT